ncbi:MAG TPA: DNA-binding transcriptional regulator OxyR [Rhodocyclaceae bacterium]|nr:DNA-binding transcriptional regulator OxyR [Rhodocyclaceae bacterium]
MNLRDLRYLVALADHRHFGRAADASFVSQPTLSTQIRKLEDELGVELFERSPRHVMLTEAGKRVVDRARIVLREADQIREIARRTQDPESGSLRIGLFPTLGPYLLPHVVQRVRARFPRLEMLLVEEKTEEVLHGLREGHLDAGLLALPVHDDQLHEMFLFEEPFVLAVPADHPLAQHEGPIGSDIIEGESLLLLEEGHCLRDQALEVCHMAGAGERNGFRATSLETLRQMVAAGVGMTLLPMLAVRPPVPPSNDIRLLTFADPVPKRRIAMFWRKTSAYREFLPKLAQIFRGLPASLLKNSFREKRKISTT